MSYGIQNNASPDLSDENIYLNVTLYNSGNDEINAEYTEERSIPILPRASDYKMTVVRFDLPTSSAPLFIFDPSNRTFVVSYQVTVPAGGVHPGRPYIGQSNIIPLSDPDFDNDFNIIPYKSDRFHANQTGKIKNIDFFEQIIYGMNRGFVTAYNNLILAYDAALPNGEGPGAFAADQFLDVVPTQVIRSPTDGLVRFYHRQESADQNIVDPINFNVNPLAIKLYLSHDLFLLFDSVFSEFYGYNTINRLDHRIIFYVEPFFTNQSATTTIVEGDEINTNLLPYDINATLPNIGVKYDVNDGAVYVINTGEFITDGLWYDVYKIVIASNSMPIRHEDLIIVNTTSDTTNSGGHKPPPTLKKGILTDVNFEFINANRQRLTYVPREYRFLDMLSNLPLYKVDFKLYLETSRGELRPILIAPHEVMNIKFMWLKV